MPMDGFTLSFMQRELRNTLLGGRVDKVNQPERDALVLLIRSGGNHKLLLSANANQARAQITAQSYENPAEPPMFCMLMRKHLMGSRIVEIEQISGDRILAITFDCLDEMGYHVRRTLYLEIMGRHSNLTLVDESGTIIDAIRHVNAEMSRVRTVLPGGTYQLPPQPDKLTPDTLTPEALRERLAPLTCALSKGLMECVAGMASVCSKEVCAQIGIAAATPISELDLVYLDPPYNQHPYGSNYFMLNVIAENRIPGPLSRVSGIPQGWNRSDYNRQAQALDSFTRLIADLNARFVLVSYNSEGFITLEQMEQMRGQFGRVTRQDITYNAYRASRNLSGREMHVQEYLFLLEKVR